MKQRNPIFYGAILLTGSNLLLRLAAMSFQVFLSGRIGAAGVGLLQLIASVRELTFALGAAGVRACAMYLSAEALGRGRPQGIPAVLTGCFRYGLACSVPAACCLWRLAPWLSEHWIGDMAAVPPLRVYALFLPVRCLYAVLSGHFSSAGRIRTLVLVEFLEQGCAMAATFFLLSRWAGADAGRACLAVAAGGCAASGLSFCVLFSLSRRHVPPRAANRRPPYRRILRMALPLGVAEGLRSGLNALENLLVPRRLALFAGTVNAMADYGVVHGMVFPVLMFPAAILFSLAELLIPELSRCGAGRRRGRVQYLVRRGLRVALLFGLCAGGMLFCGADALGELLYHDPAVGAYLRLYAPLAPMLYTDAITDAACKGLGQQNANARYNTLTSFLDAALLWLLLPRFGMGGYYFSFAVTHLVNFCLSLRRLLLASELRPDPGTPLRAVFCAGAAGAAASLLPAGEGALGAALTGAVYLLLLGLLWTVFRVVGRGDVRWVRGLLRGRRS
nr:polysaccharide biosynthesis C-terminal domain-containing protein [uncultured Oscillibacter sp.]